MSLARNVAVILLLIASACGKHTCDDQWETMGNKRDAFISAYAADHSTAAVIEAEAITVFGDPNLKTTLTLTGGSQADIWRWDISADEQLCGKWWAQFPPAAVTVGREDSFPHPAGLP